MPQIIWSHLFHLTCSDLKAPRDASHRELSCYPRIHPSPWRLRDRGFYFLYKIPQSFGGNGSTNGQVPHLHAMALPRGWRGLVSDSECGNLRRSCVHACMRACRASRARRVWCAARAVRAARGVRIVCKPARPCGFVCTCCVCCVSGGALVCACEGRRCRGSALIDGRNDAPACHTTLPATEQSAIGFETEFNPRIA